jgi:hypothetical protein
LLAAAAVLLSAHPLAASACAICYGEPDSPVSKGLSYAIIALGMIVAVVLAGITAFFVHTSRKASVVSATEAATALVEK